jgi:23S rRNA (cytidine1920-2'-O)/16S rRNA (cytidine1409-2'-O)-methyltransferase
MAKAVKRPDLMMKERLDMLLVARGLSETREKAQRVIMAGDVFVNGQRVDKAGASINVESEIEVRSALPYVSRGGYKLAHALDQFKIDVGGKICADVGASTGGFTDVLLQRGVAKVYAIDVGYGQLDWKLRNDPRVVVMERTNIREVESLLEPIAFACVDVSFISLKLVLPVVRKLMTFTSSQTPLLQGEGSVVALIKPQFEAGKALVGKGGVVRDPKTHRAVLVAMLDYCAKENWAVKGLTMSPIKGPAGNVEFLIHLTLAPASETISTMTLIDGALTTAAQLSKRND